MCNIYQKPLDMYSARRKIRCMAAQSKLTEENVRAALQLASGNRLTAANLLKVDRVTLWRAMKRFGISPTWTRRDAA